MTTDQKIKAIKGAIAKAHEQQSKLSPQAINVPALSSLRLRHLMNQLGSISTHYLEHGPHKGGLFCSTIFGNDNLISATAVDCYASDFSSGDEAKPQFLKNVSDLKPDNLDFELIHKMSFDVLPEEIRHPIDLYLFDADHSEDSQCRALTHFLPSMADEFIFCVDDYSWEDVRNGTQRGIKESGVEILFEKELITDHEYDNDSYWDGYYVALLKKKV